MEILLSLLTMTFSAACIIGWLWIVVNAFAEGGALWGIGCLLFGPIAVVYAVLNFAQLKSPVLLIAGGCVGMFLLFALTGNL